MFEFAWAEQTCSAFLLSNSTPIAYIRPRCIWAPILFASLRMRSRHRFNSGEPRCRRQMDKSPIARTARTSLCQFCKDGNQNSADDRKSDHAIGATPSSARLSFSSRRPPARCQARPPRT